MSFFGTVLVGAFVWNGDVCMFGRLKVGTPVPADALFVCACCGFLAWLLKEEAEEARLLNGEDLAAASVSPVAITVILA